MKQKTSMRIIGLCMAVIMMLGMLPLGISDSISVRAAALDVGDPVDAVNADGATEAFEITHKLSDLTPNANGVIELDATYHEKVVLVDTDASGGIGNIRVADGVRVALILNGVTRSSASNATPDTTLPGGELRKSPLQLVGSSYVTLVLVDGTVNTFNCNGSITTTDTAQAGIWVTPNATLRILGQSGNTGELRANSGPFSAGIGGGPNQASGIIRIEGGIVRATNRTLDHISAGAGNGAGIGAGGGHTAVGNTSKQIDIRGNAVVFASSAGRAAGIGGGASNQRSSGSGNIINISGNAQVTASSALNGAGIGGGGNDQDLGGAAGIIQISGNAQVVATSAEGVGIGGGGSNTGSAGSGGTIHIFGNADVTAGTTSATGTGAAIGSGGTNTAGTTGIGGTITIYGDATVTATAAGNGAAIGSGGTNSGTNFGAGSNITIQDNAVVSVIGGGNGAAIGSGGSNAANAGAGGSIIISGTPIVTTTMTNANANGLGAGVNSAGVAGTAGNIRIDGGNVFAAKADVVRNTAGDEVGMITVSDTANKTLSYLAKSSAASTEYLYEAITDASGSAHVWLPLNNQIIIYQGPAPGNVVLGSEIVTLVSGWNEITPPVYEYHFAEAPLEINWDGASAMSPYTYVYRQDLTTLTLIAHDADTLTNLEDENGDPIKWEITNVPAYGPYNYYNDIADLTTLVDAAMAVLDTPYGLSPILSTAAVVPYITFDPLNPNVAYVNYHKINETPITVQIVLGDGTESINISYAIPGVPNKAVTMEATSIPNFSAFGYEFDLAGSILTATAPMPIILRYKDVRHKVTVRDNLGSAAVVEYIIPTGTPKRITPPYRYGYYATEYSVNSGSKISIGSSFTGYAISGTGPSATEITFYYKAIQIGGSQTGGGQIIVTPPTTPTPSPTDNSGAITAGPGGVVIQRPAPLQDTFIPEGVTYIPNENAPLGVDIIGLPHIDVHTSDWFFDSVAFAYVRGLMVGTSTDPMLFSPLMSTSRAMIVTILHNMAGRPSAPPSTFSDVPENEWYSAAIAWGQQNNVVSGKDHNIFDPHEPISRQDLALILTRYAAQAGLSLPPVRQPNAFSDAAETAEYAAAAVETLYTSGVISGKPGNIFDPWGRATRAEVATVLYQFMDAAVSE